MRVHTIFRKVISMNLLFIMLCVLIQLLMVYIHIYKMQEKEIYKEGIFRLFKIISNCISLKVLIKVKITTFKVINITLRIPILQNECTVHIYNMGL